MAWSNVASIGGSLVGGWLANKDAKKAASAQNNTSTSNSTTNSSNTNELNPVIANMLGTTGGGGIINSLSNSLTNGGSSLSGQGNAFLNANAGQILGNGYAATNSLMAGNYLSPSIQAAQVEAPSQNKMDLTGSYNRFINGTPGANPYLDQSIQGAINQNRLGFQQLQDDSNKNLMQNILPSIRSNSVLSGQYGGSRQGIAEGNAIGTQQTELNRTASQFGQNATNAAVGAKANAYETDSNRALSATQGLGAQQYATAMQDAAARQAGDNTNVNALIATRGQNDSNIATGTTLQQGLLGAAAGYGNADLTRLGGQAGILAPFTNAGATVKGTSTTNATGTGPLFSNTAGATAGGAMLGGQMGGMLGGWFNNLAGGGQSGGGNMGSIFDMFGKNSSLGGNYGGSYGG